MRNSILVVDDDPQILRLCKLTLEETGYSVLLKRCNGKEALAVLDNGFFDLILLDLSMPDMDGLEFLMAVRAKVATPGIIVMSGFLGGALLPAAEQLSSIATLPKPFSLDQLLTFGGSNSGPHFRRLKLRFSRLRCRTLCRWPGQHCPDFGRELIRTERLV